MPLRFEGTGSSFLKPFPFLKGMKGRFYCSRFGRGRKAAIGALLPQVLGGDSADWELIPPMHGVIICEIGPKSVESPCCAGNEDTTQLQRGGFRPGERHGGDRTRDLDDHRRPGAGPAGELE